MERVREPLRTMATALHLTAEASPGFIRPTRELVADVAKEHGLSEHRAEELKLCLHEAMANVVRHAYEGRPGPVDVTLEDRGDELAVVVSDHGDGGTSRIRNGGGLGLQLMSRLSQSCTICAHRDGMEVKMVFPVRTARRSEPTLPYREQRLLHF